MTCSRHVGVGAAVSRVRAPRRSPVAATSEKVSGADSDTTDSTVPDVTERDVRGDPADTPAEPAGDTGAVDDVEPGADPAAETSREPTPLTPTELLPALDRPAVPPIRPVAAAVVGQRPGAVRYDLSPDGRWKVTHDVDGVCVTTIDDTERVCADAVEFQPGRIEWSPDSTRVVVSPSLLRGDVSQPLVTLSTTGEVVTVKETTGSSGMRPGDALSAAFIAADTIVYSAFGADLSSTEFWTIGVEGSDERRALEFTAAGAEQSSLIAGNGFLGDDLVLYSSVNLALADESAVARLDLASETWLPLLTLRTLRPDGPPVGERVVAAASDVAVTVDSVLKENRTVNRDLEPFHEIVAVDGSVAQRIDDLMLLSTATTRSLLDGAPEWFDLTGIAPTNASQDWDGLDTSIVWTRDDVLWLELEDRIVEVAVEPAG